MNLPGGGMPSPEYLASLNARLPPSPAMTADPRVAELPPAGPPPPPVVAAPPAPAAVPFAAGPAPSTYFDQPPPAASPWSGPDPTAALAQGIASNAPPAAPAPAATQQPQAPAPEHRPFLQQIGGAGVVNRPAHETELRGPQLKQAQAEGHIATRQAIDEVSARNAEMAAADFRIANQQEDEARARQQVAANAAVTQQQEMQQRQADFDQSVKAMSAMSVDPGRFWANQNTGQKLASIIALGIGGFTAGHNGGGNPVQEQVNRMVDADIKAQEFAYHAAHDAANAKQSAFSMAMQKYQNADQARAAARAASLDAVQAQVAQQAALWKGTAAADRASMANAGLQDDKTKEIAQGVAYTPASQVAVGAQYRDPRTGLTYSEKEAKDLVKTMDANEFAREQKGTDVAGQLMVQGAKDKAEGVDSAGLDKASRQSMALEAAKAQRELDANIAAMHNARNDMKAIVAGGPADEVWSHNPAWIPGATGARIKVSTREAYNRRVLMAMGAAYKMSTDSTDPKRKEALDHLIAPVVINDTDNLESGLAKNELLTKLLNESAAAKGGEKPALPASLTFHGGK